MAVKILRDGLPEEARLRFQQEAAFLARCDHPHVVGVIDFGEGPWSAPRGYSLEGESWYAEFARSAPVKTYIALEWINGHTLEDYILGEVEPPPNLATKLEWFLGASEALINVHANGLIHRDIKPSNLMVTQAGVIKLMDFGIARTQAEDRTLMTATGHGLGTPAYMAPEQIRAEEALLEVGPAADLYGLCATFYEVLTGIRLYHHDRESAETVRTLKLTNVLPHAPRTLAPGVEWELEIILLGGLQPEVSDRYRSAEALARDLLHVRNDEPIEYRRPSLLRRIRLTYRRNRIALNTAGIFCAIIVVLTAWYLIDITQEEMLAEQRAARLTTKVARTKSEEGSVDEALLLLLDAAGHFNESSVPDEVRIAFHRTLERASKQKIYEIPRNANIFELKDAFYIVDPEAFEILRFDGSESPQKIWVENKPIHSLGLHPNGKDLILIDKDLHVKTIDWRNRNKEDIGDLKKLPTPQDHDQTNIDIDIANDGLVILQQQFSSANKEAAEIFVYYYLLDVGTKKDFSGTVQNESALAYAKLPSLERYLFGKTTAINVTSFASKTQTQTKIKNSNLGGKLLFYSCFGTPDKRIASYANVIGNLSFIKDPTMNSKCEILDNFALIKETQSTPAGFMTSYKIIDKKGEELNAFSIERKDHSSNHLRFFEIEPTNCLTAAMINRDVYIKTLANACRASDQPEIEDDQPQNEFDAHIRFPYSAAFGRFVGLHQIALIDNVRNKIVMIDLKKDRTSSYNIQTSTPAPGGEHAGISAESSSVNGLEQRIVARNRGTCVGHTGDFIKKFDVLPNGDEIVFPGGNLTSSEGENAETGIVFKGKEQTYKLEVVPADFRCIQFSHDWKFLLVLSNDNVKIYDFETAKANKTLESSLLGEIKEEAITSAFFTAPENNVITSDWIGRVRQWAPQPEGRRWSASELYRGNFPLRYAEPDKDQKRLLLIEDVGRGDVHGSLYSLDAREEMFDLGSEYKWLGLAFTDKLDIAVVRGAALSELIRLPTLEELVRSAGAALSPACRPPVPGDYRKSACWPVDVPR